MKSKDHNARIVDMLDLLQEVQDSGELVALEASTEWGTPIEQQAGEKIIDFLRRACDQTSTAMFERQEREEAKRRRDRDEALREAPEEVPA